MMSGTPSQDALSDFEKALLWETENQVWHGRKREARRGLAIALKFGNCFFKKEGSDLWPAVSITSQDVAPPRWDSSETMLDFGLRRKAKLDGSEISTFGWMRVHAKRVEKLDELLLKPDRIFGVATLSEAASRGAVSPDAVLWKLWRHAAAGNLVLLDDQAVLFSFGPPEKLILDWSLRGGN